MTDVLPDSQSREKDEALFQEPPKAEAVGEHFEFVPDPNAKGAGGVVVPKTTPAPSKEEPKKLPMTDAEFKARADELFAEAKASGVDYVGLLAARYGIESISSFVKNALEYGFSKNKGK